MPEDKKPLTGNNSDSDELTNDGRADPAVDEIRHVMEETRMISATALVLAGIMYNVLTSNLNHQLPHYDNSDLSRDNCTAEWHMCEYHILKMSYVITGSAGAMLLFSTALVAYQLSAECKRRLSLELVGLERFVSLAKFWNNMCLIFGFCGMFLSIGAEAISLSLNHSDGVLTPTCFVAPIGLIFAAGLFVSVRIFPFKE